jgi:hypothetical protein
VKLLAWIALLSLSLWAENAEVQFKPLTLSINGKSNVYQLNSKLTIPYDVNVCITQGDGLLIITDSSSDQKEFTRMGLSEDVCFLLLKPQIEEPKEDNRSWYEKLWQGIVTFSSQESKDKKKNGIATKEYEE